MPSVLFVCTGNQYRSPIAAAYLQRLLQERGLTAWLVESAGTWAIPGQSSYPDARQDAEGVGLELEGHRTRLVDKVMLDKYDLILVMEKGHKEALKAEFPPVAERTYLLAEMVEGIPFDIPDPLARPDQHDEILQDMCNVIEGGFPRIRQLALVFAGSRP